MKGAGYTAIILALSVFYAALAGLLVVVVSWMVLRENTQRRTNAAALVHIKSEVPPVRLRGGGNLHGEERENESKENEHKNQCARTCQEEKLNKRESYLKAPHARKSKECCQKRCLRQVLDDNNIETCTRLFWSKSEEEQRAFIIDYLFIMQSKKGCGRLVYEYKISGKNVCQKAWRVAYGISNGRFHKLRRDFEKGCAHHIGNRAGPRDRKSERYMRAERWFEEFVKSMADHMPHEDKLHLPSCYTKERVFNTYKETMISKRSHPLSRSQFRRMWKQEYKRVIIPKVNRFTKCGVCTLIKENILHIRDKKRRLSWLEKKDLHLKQQSAERKKYYKHKSKAEEDPSKYLSVICDGMDQAKTNIPHFQTKSKTEGEHAEFLKTHVTGVLSHGCRRSWCLIDLLRYPSDANVTIGVVLHALHSIVCQKGSLPPTLYWQMDNCYKDCKNVYIFGFCAYLVMIGAFKKVKLSYLMVGHTHEDVDQMFSRISGGLRRSNAETLDALRSVIRKSYTPQPCTSLLNTLFDMKEWLRPFIMGFKNHSMPHCFKFKMNRQGEVEMVYRYWATSEKWLPARPFIVMRSLPPGTPSVLKPENLKNPTPDEMDARIKHLGTRLTVADSNWWESFTRKERDMRACWETITEDDLEEASKLGFKVDILKYKEPVPLEKNEEDRRVERAEREILKQINKERDFTEVKALNCPPKKRKKVQPRNNKRTKTENEA